MTNAPNFLILGLVLALHLFLLINTRFTIWPEMVVYPYLANNDFKLYTEIINPYPPLLTWFLMIFSKVFGYKPLPFQILTWLVIFFTDVVIYKVAHHLHKSSQKALMAAIFFAVLSIPFGANGLWFDLFQIPLILLSVSYLINFVDRPKNTANLYKLFLMLSIAFFIKQQIVWLVITTLIILFLMFGKKTKEILLKTPMIFAPFIFLLLFTAFILWRQGSLADYLFWVFYFPFFLSSQMPGYLDLPKINHAIVIISLLFPFFLLTLTKNSQTKVILAFAASSILFIFPRFDFFHLVPTLALLSLAAPHLLGLLKSKLTQIIVVAGFAAVIVFSVRVYIKNWGHQVRFFEPEIYQTASYLREINPSGRPVYIQNGPDQIFPMAGLLPPKPWADEFPWYLEIPNVQHRIVQALEQASPLFIVYKPYAPGEPYEIGAYKPQQIVEYLNSHYRNFARISDTLWLKIKN